ncbi:MAG: DUF3833 family protein [Sphingomonas bacterium]|nr:DUF3833 family protein [Sphingomonas bacterium]
MFRPLILAVALVGCTAAAPANQPAGFDPLAFFSGASRGEGQLRIALKAPVTIRVESQGRADGNGGIIIDQTISEGTKPPRQRRWTLRQTSATTMSGTITDTPGLVSGRMRNGRLHLNYKMKNGLKAEQTLTLQPGGRSVVNKMVVRKMGIAVAHLDELITKTS